MTEPITELSAAVAAVGALPMPVGNPVEPMSERRLAEIKNRRYDEVTSGPWLVANDQHGNAIVYVECQSPEGQTLASVLLVADGAAEEDVQFVCSARRSVPELLAEVERLKGALRSATDEVAELEHEIGGWSARVSRMKSLFSYGGTKPYHKGWNDAVARVREIATEDEGAAS